MKVLAKDLVFPNPPGVTTAYEYEYYSRPTGVDKARLRFLDISDDIFDGGSLSFSTDNGRTWRDERPHGLGQKINDATTLRRFDGLGFVDPVEGKLVNLYIEGLFRKDMALEGMRNYYLSYRVSNDGGRTNLVDTRAIQKGDEFDAQHPFKDVWVGKNAVLMPIIPSMVRIKNGPLCAVVSRTLLDQDGNLYNPGGGFTWAQEMVLHGHWQRDGRIDWEPVADLALTPEQSTRGIDESTLAQMSDGTLLLVMRASNDYEDKLQGYKWFATSRDGGRTWTDVKPWGYSDGSLFYSSASMCQLLEHSNGKHYWLGNISPENPKGNLPRNVLHIAEVDQKTLCLKKETVFEADRIKPHEMIESPQSQLSNFYAHEDRESHEIILDMPYFTKVNGAWTGDTFRYRISVD